MPGTRTTGGEEMLRTVAAVLRDRGAEGWLVGGTVRDRELDRFSPDLDLCVAGDAAGITRNVAQALAAPWFALSEQHRAYRVVGRQGHVDIAAVRGGGILADLAQRDFTVNAMAIPVNGGELLDPFGGLVHLRARLLVPVSDGIFREDPLRLMRAARFSHVLGLRLDSSLCRAVKAQAADVSRAAPERVATEMILTLAAGRAGDAARLWQELGLLRAVVPELRRCEEAGGREGPARPEGPGSGEDPDRVFAVLDRLEEMLGDIPLLFPAAAALLRRRLIEPVDGAVERRVALRLAGLFRELGPARTRIAGHRLRVSGALVSLLETAARMNHFPEGLPAVEGTAPVTADHGVARPANLPAGPGRGAVLFLWAAAPWEPEVLLLAAAAAPAGAALEAVAGLLTVWAERNGAGDRRPPVDGVILMRELSLPPGPRLGMALRAARLAWEAGEATTAEQAVAAAREALRRG